MNIERYVWPVIIAASFHGALLLITEKYTPPLPQVEAAPPARDPVIPIELFEPPEPSAGDAGSGSVDPIPSQPDIPKPESEAPFKMPVSAEVTSIKPVLKLPENPSGPLGPGGMGDIIGRPSLPSVHSLDRIPRATVRPSPNYPNSLRDTSGSVTVEFVVDTTGRVVSADAVRWTHREFVDPAVRAVLRWRFEPGTLNGRPVSFRMAVPIEFNSAL